MVQYASALSAVICSAHAHADGFHLDLGDLPTWLGVLAASVAAYFVYRQLGSQRQQLKVQQDDIARQRRALERQQADKVDVRSSKEKELRPPQENPPRPQYWHMTVIHNNSERPIRNVTARLRPPGEDPEPPVLVVRFELGSDNARNAEQIWTPLSWAEADTLPLMRAREHWGFVYRRTVPEDSTEENVLTSAHFTDDAGLHWHIDGDMHLEPLDERDW